MASRSRNRFIVPIVRAFAARARQLRRGLDPVRRRLRPVRRRLRIARHLLSYHVPGEQQRCPACGGDAVRRLEPLTSARRRFTYGFIAGCPRCGLLFADPLPDPEELATVYSPEGEWGRHRQEEHEKPVTRKRLERQFAPVLHEFDVLHPPPGAAVLDFGCGLGGMLDALSAIGWETWGIDPATKLAFDRHHELTSVPAEPRFDLAILHHVLEHVTDPLAILRSLAAAVRPGGYLLVSVPNVDQLAEHGELKYCIRSRVHLLAYSSDCLQWLLCDAGFRVVSSSPGPRHLRQRVVLARREEGTRPEYPLRAATRALRAYFSKHPEAAAPLRVLPVRVRAGYADLVRAEWRLAK